MYPDRFAVDAELLRKHLVDSPLLDWGASRVVTDGNEIRGFVAIKKSATPALYTGSDPDASHLSAIVFDEPTLGVELMADAKSVLRDRGVYRLVFGQDSGHLWPSCPNDCPQLRTFLTVEGFAEGGEVVDLERDLGDYAPSAETYRPLREWPGGEDPSGLGEVREVGAGEEDLLAAHLEREFPGRWRYDVIEKFRVEGPGDIYGLYLGDQIEGFAMTQRSTHKMPVAGAVWHRSLGEHWGALGPIGVARSLRGKGYGRAVLAAALTGLKQKGARQTIIDWTNLAPFYEAQGFFVTRRYLGMTLRLS